MHPAFPKMSSVKLHLGSHLDIVMHDDQIVVENVASVMLGLSREYSFHDFEIKKVNDGYVLMAKASSHASISLTDLQLLKDCNPVRVQDVFISVSEGKICLNVKILNGNVPVTITETEVIRVKKRKMWNFFK